MLSSENMFANGFIIIDASGVEYATCIADLDLDILMCFFFEVNTLYK